MSKPRVLITSVSRKVSLVWEFKKAGWFVIGQDIREDAPAKLFCNKAVIDIDSENFDLLLRTRDAELDYWYQDKEEFQEFLRLNGLQHPRTYFVKSVAGGRAGERFLYQEVVRAPEYSVDCYVHFDGTVIGIVPRLREKIVDGESWITTTVKDDEMLEQAKLIVEKLEFTGHCVLQCFKDGNTIKWFEINPRYGGASVCSIKAGLKSPEWYKKSIKEQKLKPRIGEYKIGLKMLRYTQDIFI